MTQLNKIQSIIFLAGGALMVIGAGCFAMMWQQRLTCWVFSSGRPDVHHHATVADLRGHRPHHPPAQAHPGLCQPDVILAGLLMADNAYGFFRPLFSNAVDYVNYIFNKWVILLLAAAILEVYTVHRIDHELSQKNIKE
jgi:hypothetical protein